MEIENLVRLKNLVNSADGKLLVMYLSDYLTKNCCARREPSEVKGMGELLHVIKSIPQELEKKRSNQ